MSLTATNWPAATGRPFSVNEPAAGSVVIRTLMKLSGGLTRESLRRKVAAFIVWALTALVGFGLSVPVGEWCSAVTLIVMVLGVASRFALRFVMLPSSRTWNVKL